MRGFPGSSDGKASAYNVGDLGSIPGLGRSPGDGNDNLLQYSCLENPRDREAWKTTVHGVAKVSHDLVTNRPPSPTCYVNPKLLIYPSLIIVFLKSVVRGSVGA